MGESALVFQFAGLIGHLAESEKNTKAVCSQERLLVNDLFNLSAEIACKLHQPFKSCET